MHDPALGGGAAAQLSPDATVRAYTQLATVERAFRCLEGLDLQLRPVHHRLADRVRAHVLLCMLAYYVEWHMRRALAPLLFAEDDPADAAARRRSSVAPAKCSARARHEAASQRTPDGLPVQSFPELLRALSTVAKTRVQPKAVGVPAFDRLPTLMPLQARAFTLLQVAPHVSTGGDAPYAALRSLGAHLRVDALGTSG